VLIAALNDKQQATWQWVARFVETLQLVLFGAEVFLADQCMNALGPVYDL